MAHRLLTTVKREHQPDGLALSVCRIYRNAEYDEYIVKPLRAGVVQPESTWYFTDYRSDANGTACAMLWPLGADQLAAVNELRRLMGRNWKQELRYAWIRGSYVVGAEHAAALQQLRNTYGPEWLNAYPA